MTDSDAIDAVVLGGVDYGEADRIVHLITQLGRTTAFAHGAKKSRRRFAGALDPFTTIRASLTTSKKRTSSMPTLSSAVVASPRLALRRDLTVIALGSYLTELTWRVTPEGAPSETIFELVEQTLDWLTEHDATNAVRRAFELRLMVELGYAPELSRCLECGDATERPHVDFLRGGVLCEAHAGAAALTGPKTITWTMAVLSTSRFDPIAGLDEEWAERAANKITAPLGAFWPTLLDRPLKAAKLLDELSA